MFTRDDLIDAILRRLQASDSLQAADRGLTRGSAAAEALGAAPAGFLKGRRFLTEHEIRKALTPGARVLTIPTGAIVSPLAQEWLALKGIEILRSDP